MPSYSRAMCSPDVLKNGSNEAHEIDPMRLRPHPYEFHLYYDVKFEETIQWVVSLSSSRHLTREALQNCESCEMTWMNIVVIVTNVSQN